MKPTNWFTLRGETIVALRTSDEEVTIQTASGREILLSHHQNCCECVRLVKEVIPQLPFGPIVLAEEDNPSDPKCGVEPSDCSHTWTLFMARDEADRELSLLWLGESNGYYGEGVSVEEKDV